MWNVFGYLRILCGYLTLSSGKLTYNLNKTGWPLFDSHQGQRFYCLRHKALTDAGSRPISYLRVPEILSQKVKRPGRDANKFYLHIAYTPSNHGDYTLWNISTNLLGIKTSRNNKKIIHVSEEHGSWGYSWDCTTYENLNDMCLQYYGAPVQNLIWFNCVFTYNICT
jgi:hypothetical protein